MKRVILILIAAFSIFNNVIGQEQKSKWDFDASLGAKVGGAAPLGFPEEIREIKSYGLAVPFFIKMNTEYRINSVWGIRTGLVFEGKGMNTEANVKGYKTTFNAEEDPSENMRGYYYGDISTIIDNVYLTVPLQATYHFDDRWDIQFGPYLSYALSRRFYGKAIKGYIRDEVPTGEKIAITDVQYNFANSVRKFDVGASLGTRYRFGASYHALAQFDYGVNSIMQTGFESISFKMHNIFMNFGVGVTM